MITTMTVITMITTITMAAGITMITMTTRITMMAMITTIMMIATVTTTKYGAALGLISADSRLLSLIVVSIQTQTLRQQQIRIETCISSFDCCCIRCRILLVVPIQIQTPIQIQIHTHTYIRDNHGTTTGQATSQPAG